MSPDVRRLAALVPTWNSPAAVHKLTLCALTLTLIFVLTGAVSSASARTNKGFPVDGLLVFSDEGTLYTIAPDGSGLRSLGELAAFEPRWSPSGQLIAYSGESEAANERVWLVRSDGSTPKQLTHPAPSVKDFSPAWFPRGGQLVFDRFVPGRIGVKERRSLREIRIDRSGSRLLRSGAPILSTPDWSPNGKRIAGYVYGADSTTSRLMVVEADGSSPRRLGPKGVEGQKPRWSPDGTRVAFVDESANSVRVLDLRTGRVRTVFDVSVYGNDFGWYTAWSPDGRWLAVMKDALDECVDFDPTAEFCEHPELWIVNATDGREKLVYSGQQYGQSDGLDWRAP